MNNKAFTLVELLTVIIILGLLATITVPNVMNAINISKEKSYNSQVNMIEKAAERWAIDNIQIVNSKENISLAELKTDGYLDKSEVINPKTKEEMNGCVFIIKDNNNYKYEYSETCT